jgi:GntR family transcriptional regulator, rspAB operon transcriptional repressor
VILDFKDLCIQKYGKNGAIVMTEKSQLSAAERCYRILSRKIVSLELKPNESVGEQALAELLGVSRTPIREALSRLSDEGLVDLRARSGGIVSPIRPDAVRDAQFVRENLEAAVIAEAAKRSNPRILLAIRQTIEEQELAISENNSSVFYLADERMHYLFCCLAGREGVWDFIADSKKHMDRVRRISIQNGHLDELLDDHHNLVDAVAAGKVAQAQELMRSHLSRVLLNIEEYANRFPQYFEISDKSETTVMKVASAHG